MTNYRVAVPISGVLMVDINATSPEDAVKAVAKEIALRVKDLGGYDAQDASAVEHEIWVPNVDAEAQVLNNDAPEDGVNVEFVPIEVYHKVAK